MVAEDPEGVEPDVRPGPYEGSPEGDGGAPAGRSVVGELEVIPTQTWVVMEGRVGAQTVWAWCLVGTGPGFDEVAFTEGDGMTVPELDEAPSRFDRHLFTVTVPRG